MAQLTADSAIGSADTRSEGRFQLGALAGVALGTLAVFGPFIIEGGNLPALILPSPFMIVVGGTLAALLIAYPASDVAGIPSLVGRVFTGRRTAEGAQLLRDAGTYAIITSLVALVMAAIVVLSNFAGAKPDEIGHAASVAFVAPLYGLILALVCYALSRRLRGRAA